MDKLVKGSLIFLSAIGVVVFLLAVTQIDQADQSTYGYADPILYVGYIYTIVAAVLWLVATVQSMAAKPENLKKQAINAGIFIALFAVCYALADGSDFAKYPNDISESTSRYSGMLLYVAYTLSVGAAIAWAFSSIFSISR